MEQLNAFVSASNDFKAEGISVIGISSDPIEAVKQTAQNRHVPFLLLSNEDLRIFKAYRAYDDFENIPLHAAFLVDGEGKIRWQDISYQPFKDTKFLLAESKRLLGLSKTEGAN